jgi:hypothetical protein
MRQSHATLPSRSRNATACPRTRALAHGEDSFNLCFPGGMELETMVVPDGEGRPALRVFWAVVKWKDQAPLTKPAPHHDEGAAFAVDAGALWASQVTFDDEPPDARSFVR